MEPDIAAVRKGGRFRLSRRSANSRSHRYVLPSRQPSLGLVVRPAVAAVRPTGMDLLFVDDFMGWCVASDPGQEGEVMPLRRIAVWTAIVSVAALLTPASAWQHWGGDAGGTRFSPLTQITPANVDRLVRAWEYHTGDSESRPPAAALRTKFEATPLLVDDSLVFCTPFNEVVALDPGTGAQTWRFDPKVGNGLRPANRYACRGVAHWVDERAPADAACRSRLFMGTVDARLIAIDARTGRPCAGFGTDGEVRIDIGKELLWPGEFQITSAPVVGRDVVVVGSSIGDNVRVDAPKGTVRGFDARTGALRWSFDPLIRDGITAGHANVWAPMSVDEERGLVLLPTSSPSPDFFGGARPGDNRHADSVVALRIETGALAWSFQTVHHDVWDYDLPAQPTLARLDTAQGARDVVMQPTKQGFVFVLDRDTGSPIWPVEERAVPQGAVEGERLSPTQPFPTHVPPLLEQRFAPEDIFRAVPRFLDSSCDDQLATLRNDGLYTPPTMAGTLLYPMTGGGVNWGSAAFDPVRQILYANVSRAIHIIRLIPRDQADAMTPPRGVDFGLQRGAPFAVTRVVAMSRLGLLCNRPPWGEMVALDLKAGRILWRATVGTTEDRAPLGLAFKWARRWSAASSSRPAGSSLPVLWTPICAPSMPVRVRSSGRGGCRSPASPIP